MKIIEDEERKYEDEMLKFWDLVAHSIISGRRLKKTSGAIIVQSCANPEPIAPDASSIFAKVCTDDYNSFDQL